MGYGAMKTSCTFKYFYVAPEKMRRDMEDVTINLFHMQGDHESDHAKQRATHSFIVVACVGTERYV